MDKEYIKLISAILLQAVKDLKSKSPEIKEDAQEFFSGLLSRKYVEIIGLDYDVFIEKIGRYL